MDETKIHLNEFPPNFSDIVERFPGIRGKAGIVYSWDDKVYVPKPLGPLPDHVLVHEAVHRHQQDGDPGSWWVEYLDVTTFRWEQELEAYRIQWWYVNANYGRAEKRKILQHICNSLASPMYEFGISAKAARVEILA